MIKGIPMTLGDGNEYVIPPLTLGALEDFEDDIASIDIAAGPKAARTIVDISLRALIRNYPDITRNDVRELIDLANMEEVFVATMDVSGAKRKALETEGEVEAVSGKQRRR